MADSLFRDMSDLVDAVFAGDVATQKHAEEDYQKVLHPFDNLEKAAVLQEARIFHDSTDVREHPMKCCRIIAQMLRLQDLATQPFSEPEATEVFFGATKLFVSNDASLRRMVYLFLKEIYLLCDPNDVIIVTSSLTKDMTCDIDLYRANALRVLSRIIDSAMLGAIERYVKQAIVDSSPQVASAALVSASRLFDTSPDCAAIVKRWITETQQAIASRNYMVQFHGIQLLYQIKSHDRLGVSKLVSQYGSQNKNSVKSPLAIVLLIRYTAKLLYDEITSGRTASGEGSIQNASALCREGYKFLHSRLGHKSDMVVYEAARAICHLPLTEPQDINPAVNVLRKFLASSKPATRYASVKMLAHVASHRPGLVSKCNPELEGLIGDSNKAIGTLAVTTLVKTGNESSIDELLGQISSFLANLSDEYRIAIVRSLQQLCLAYPAKHQLLVGFMCTFLREEGGFDFKQSIVDTIVTLIRAVPETAASSLLYLSEFIEDCEYVHLSTQILHLLGELGPTTPAPARYIPFIYNRIILEQPMVRAAGVSTLAKFAAHCPSLRESIMVLLKRSLVDEDDETRDRAAVAVTILEDAMAKYPYVVPLEDAEAEDILPDVPSEDDPAASVFSPLPMSFDKLERSLQAYMHIPNAMENSEPLTLQTLPVVEDTAEEVAAATAAAAEKEAISAGVDGIAALTIRTEEKRKDPAEALYAIPELASLGRVFRSCPPVDLTESETEYVVQCLKHIFTDHVVLQFLVHNTIEDQRLGNVRVAIDTSDEDIYEATGEICGDGIEYGATGNCFTILKRNTDAALSPCTFACQLCFTVVQVDSESGEVIGESFEEEYALENLEISTSDYMTKATLPDFRRAWESTTSEIEILEKFVLQFKTQEEAVAAVIDFLGMQPCDGTGIVKSTGKPHMLHLSGVFVGGTSVLARAQVALQPDNGGVLLKIAVRSIDVAVSRMVLDCIK